MPRPYRPAPRLARRTPKQPRVLSPWLLVFSDTAAAQLDRRRTRQHFAWDRSLIRGAGWHYSPLAPRVPFAAPRRKAQHHSSWRADCRLYSSGTAAHDSGMLNVETFSPAPRRKRRDSSLITTWWKGTSHTNPKRERGMPQVSCGATPAPSLTLRVGMEDDSSSGDGSA